MVGSRPRGIDGHLSHVLLVSVHTDEKPRKTKHHSTVCFNLIIKYHLIISVNVGGVVYFLVIALNVIQKWMSFKSPNIIMVMLL